MSTIEPVKTGLGLRILEGTHQAEFHPLSRSVVSLGRASAETPYSPSYITIPEPTLSRLHAVFTWEPGASAFMLHHRSQTNPTVLNGQRVTGSHLLKTGDILALGRLVMILEESNSGAPAPKPQKTQLLLNLRSKSIEDNKIFRVPVEKNHLSLVFTNSQSTETLGPSQTETSQQIVLPAAESSELRFEFAENGDRAVIEVKSENPPAHRHTVLPFGRLSVPLRQSTPITFTPNDMLDHQGATFWLSTDANSLPPDGKSSKKSVALGQDVGELFGGTLHFLNGGWKGGTLLVATRGSASFELGPKADSLLHNLPLQNCPSCHITVQDGVTRLRATSVNEDQFVDVNGDLLFTGESTEVFSGTKVLLGEAEFLWQVEEDHKIYSLFQLTADGQSYPLTKALVKIGTAAHCEIRVSLPNIAPLTGEIKYSRDGFTYTHRNLACPARVDGEETSAGLTVPIRSGSELELAPGAIVRLERKV